MNYGISYIYFFNNKISMKLIEKYITKQLINSSLLLLLLIISIFSLSKSVQLIDLSLNRGLPIYFFFKLIFLSLPAIIPILLPIILCLSILFSYSRMRNDSELIILEGSGVSKYYLAKPVIYYGFFLSVISIIFTIYLSPSSNKNFKKLLFSIKNDYSSSLLEEGTFNTIGKDYTIFLKQRTSDGKLDSIFIHDTRKPEKPTTLIAEKGSLIKNENGNSILLEKGSQHFFSNIDKKLSVLYFDKYLLNISSKDSNDFNKKWKTPSERSLEELKYPNLENGDDRNNLQAFKAELIHRFSLPLNVLTFGFLIVSFILSQKFYRVENFSFSLKVIGLIISQKCIYIVCSNIAIKNDGFELMNFLPSFIALAVGLRIIIRNAKNI